MGKITMGEYIRRERKRKQMTIRDVSEISGIAPSSIHSIENGRQKNVANIEKVLTALGLTWQDAENAGVNFFDWELIEVNTKKDDLSYLMEYFKKLNKNELHRIRLMLEYTEGKSSNEEDSSEE